MTWCFLSVRLLCCEKTCLCACLHVVALHVVWCWNLIDRLVDVTALSDLAAQLGCKLTFCILTTVCVTLVLISRATFPVYNLVTVFQTVNTKQHVWR